MQIGFVSFAHMDGKGEENNEIVFLNKILKELKSRNVKTSYFYIGSSRGINPLPVFNYMEVPAERVNLESYTLFPYQEYQQYSEEEIAYAYNGHIPVNRTYSEQQKMIRNYKEFTFKVLENLSIYHKKNPVNLFVVFGNYLASNITKIFCKKHNIPYFVLENGYFRPFTLMIDPKGVNFESSIPKDFSFYSSIQVDEKRLKKYMLKPEMAVYNRKDTFKERKKFYSYYGIKIKNQKSVRKSSSKNVLPINKFGRYIYVPWQLQTDSQITKHSPYIKTMYDLVRITSSALEQYNKKNNDNLKIIYKAHPLYKSELEQLRLNEIERFCNSYSNLIFLTEGDNQALLQHCQAVITINSTVGFEALMNYKPVTTLGNSFYSIPGITNTWSIEEDLSLKIESMMKEGAPTENIKKFIYYLRFMYFFEIYWKNPDDKSIKRLADKLIMHANQLN
jgi:capsule polysaccharide modification protein KpsS